MKVIDLLNKIANGESLEKYKMKFKSFNNMNFENVSEYVIYDRLFEEDLNLNDEVEILDEEDEFIDIEEIENKCERNKALTEDESKENIVRNFNMLSNKINDLIKNQKKIISKLGGKND